MDRGEVYVASLAADGAGLALDLIPGSHCSVNDYLPVLLH